MKKIYILLISGFIFAGLSSRAQINYNHANCVAIPAAYSSAIGNDSHSTGTNAFSSGNGCYATGHTSTAIGTNAKATGAYSISLGLDTESSLDYSYSFGWNAKSLATESFAIGTHIKTTASGSIAIGTSDNNAILVNGINSSLMIGFNSKVPTFYISPSDISQTFTGTGRVGIATTNPIAKLHVNGNSYFNEDMVIGSPISNASLYISTLRTEGDRQVVVSDRDGKLSIIKNEELPGDNLGNHVAQLDITLHQYGLMYDKSFAPALNLNSRNEVNINSDTYLWSNTYIGSLNDKSTTSIYGKVGINTVNVPQNDLEIMGNLSVGYNTHLPDGSNSLIVSGSLGIGTSTPSAKLEIVGTTKTSQIQITDGHMDGYLLKSDANGNAIWADPTTVNAGVWQTNNDLVYVPANKHVGIGITNPSESLEVIGNAVIGGDIKGRRNGFLPLSFYAGNSNLDGSYMTLGNNINENGSIKMYSVGPESRIEFHTNGIQLMSIRADNKIVFGNPDPDGSGLVTMNVNGEIHSNLLKVEVQGWWDKVFDSDYKLQPLSEIEQYVKINRHLPDFPSESEVLQQGIDVAEMNALLLKKVEELTLHVIELEKKINKLEK